MEMLNLRTLSAILKMSGMCQTGIWYLAMLMLRAGGNTIVSIPTVRGGTSESLYDKSRWTIEDTRQEQVRRPKTRDR
jgi:hypothetical protein